MSILFILFITSLTAILVYLSIFDIKYKEIPLIPSIIGIILSAIFVVLNAVLNNEYTYFPTILNSIIGFVLLAGIILLIVKLTKEKAMGEGDIFLFGIMGVSLGLSNLMVGFMICVYSATIYGIILSIIKKKFHGLQIPLVPFISFGIIATLIFHTQIVTLVHNVTGLVL